MQRRGILPLARVKEWGPLEAAEGSGAPPLSDPLRVVRVGSVPGSEDEHLYKTLRCPRDGTTLRLPLRCDHKRTCAVCYRSWVWQEAGKVAWRLGSVFAKIKRRLAGYQPRHVTVSLKRDASLTTPEEYDGLFKRASAVLLRMGAKGGVLVVHGDRCGAYWDGVGKVAPSAHAHWIGWGRIDADKRSQDVVVKTIREVAVGGDLRKLVGYLLNHAAVVQGKHAVRYSGVCSYRAVSLPPPPREAYHDVPCPLCGFAMVREDIVDSTTWPAEPVFLRAGEPPP